MGRIHSYEGEEVIVEFDLGRCIHTGDCTHALPSVFDVKRSGRWVHPNAAPADAVAKICADCPTGALRCISKSTGDAMDSAPAENSVQVIADGPLYVHAKMTLNGEPLTAHRAALCRCGQSQLMPFCDSSHRGTGFTDAGMVTAPKPGEASESGELSITVIPGEPLLLQGPFMLLDAAGASACTSGEAELCRCGASQNKPYCDGSHETIAIHEE